jgi:hypothetical protein
MDKYKELEKECNLEQIYDKSYITDIWIKICKDLKSIYEKTYRIDNNLNFPIDFDFKNHNILREKIY